MNERIKELLEQASEYAHENRAGDWEVGPAYQDIFYKKFAELIVRECADVAVDFSNNLQSLNDKEIRSHVSRVGDRIKDQFGVTE